MAFEPVTTVDQKPAAADKPLRADAQRNRDRLVEMAASVFAERGVDASDVLHALGGIYSAPDTPEWRDRSRRLVKLLMDGLRFGAVKAG
ncbi:hypothetical protein EOA30_12675 [Mesorhizobium sp. M8A.F.Ca.ET.059.01.1.1]|nr:hypothetical protein EOA30_12675 [Mesorhizobium sp. M8A.F.Ca.ET.059.01.1.1]